MRSKKLTLAMAVAVSAVLVLGQASVSASSAVLKREAQGKEVKVLQKDLKRLGYLSESDTGYFGNATEEAVKNLQKRYGYKADGIAGKATMSLVARLLGQSRTSAAGSVAVNAKVSAESDSAVKAAVMPDESSKGEKSRKTTQSNFMPPWFGNADSKFAIGDTATVYDIGSGKSFMVKRTYGHNHADCEALTAKDTARMKSIFGGSWSWQRRAVVVSVNGLKLAASMSGMPHAGVDKVAANRTVSSRSGGYRRGTNLDAIKNNKMNGVFDIHFYKSRNHYNNRVDPKHQALVKKAAKWAEKHYKQE